VETKRGDAKDRILSADELKALGSVIDEGPAGLVVRLVALTGCRREEIVRLRWDEIDAVGQCLRLGSTKSGRSVRPLSKLALDVLASIPRIEDCPFVFPARNLKQPADLTKLIAALFDAAGLKDARAHDLRRTFATTAAGLEYSDAVVGMLLGHRPRGVTETHYIRRPDAVLVKAADEVAKIIARSMSRETADVIALRPVGRAT
jgi:integrase